MDEDVVPMKWYDSDDDNFNMDHEGTYEELALMGGEEEDASSPVRVEEEEDVSSRARVEEEEDASSQQEILTPTALRRAVVEQISITPVGEIPDFSRKQKSRVDTISEEEYQRYTLVPSWHRYFAILEVLRAGGVLDEDIRWDEMVTLHFGQNRPKYYRFKDMTMQSDKDRFDNVEDILQEAYWAGSLDKLPNHQYKHLLDSIELAKTFARRNRMFDPALIRETGPSFILKRFQQVARRLPQSCRDIKGQAELDFVIDPILDNVQTKKTSVVFIKQKEVTGAGNRHPA